MFLQTSSQPDNIPNICSNVIFRITSQRKKSLNCKIISWKVNCLLFLVANSSCRPVAASCLSSRRITLAPGSGLISLRAKSLGVAKCPRACALAQSPEKTPLPLQPPEKSLKSVYSVTEKHGECGRGRVGGCGLLLFLACWVWRPSMDLPRDIFVLRWQCRTFHVAQKDSHRFGHRTWGISVHWRGKSVWVWDLT